MSFLSAAARSLRGWQTFRRSFVKLSFDSLIVHPSTARRCTGDLNVSPYSFNRNYSLSRFTTGTNNSRKAIERNFSSSATRAQNIPREHDRVIRTKQSIFPDWSPRIWIIVLSATGGSIYYITHLEQIPETGRWRFIDFDKKYEKKLAKEEHESFLEEFKGKIIPPTHPLAQQIAGVVSRLLEANSLGVLKPPTSNPVTSGGIFGRFAEDNVEEMSTKDTWDPDMSRNLETSGFSEDEEAYAGSKGSMREWNLIVVDDSTVVNAAAGHGNIIVFTGLLPVARDENGLAAVLGHEMAHVVLRHVAERLSSLTAANFVVTIMGLLGLDMGLGYLLMTYLYSLPNSRIQELEADKIGMRLAAKACFDPRAAVEVPARLLELENMNSRGRLRMNLDFLQTHPSGERRIQDLRKELPEAYAIRASSSECAGLQDDFDAFREAAGTILENQLQRFS